MFFVGLGVGFVLGIVATITASILIVRSAFPSSATKAPSSSGQDASLSS